jgi:hypothetical protein
MTSPEKQPENQQTEDRTYDPRDLVTKPGYSPNTDTDPQEVVDNPLHTPQMLNDSEDLRDDLQK